MMYMMSCYLLLLWGRLHDVHDLMLFVTTLREITCCHVICYYSEGDYMMSCYLSLLWGRLHDVHDVMLFVTTLREITWCHVICYYSEGDYMMSCYLSLLLREITWCHVICYYSEGDYMMSCYLLLFFNKYNITVRSLSLSHYNRPTNFFLRNMDLNGLNLPEILKLCPWKWQYECEFAIHNMNEWILNSRFVYIAYIDVFFLAFQWYDIMRM